MCVHDAPRATSPSRAGRLVRRGSAFAALLAVGSLTACGGAGADSAGVTTELVFDPPAVVGDTTCSVRVFDAAGAPMSGARVDIEGNMNHAGMVPVLRTAEEVEPGLYRTPFEFTMGGDWFVILSIDTPDGDYAEVVWDLPAVPVPRKLSDQVRPAVPVLR